MMCLVSVVAGTNLYLDEVQVLRSLFGPFPQVVNGGSSSLQHAKRF
jgi:hypothetical protein